MPIRLATQILATKRHQESKKSHSLVLSRGRCTLSMCGVGSQTNQIKVTTRVQSSNYDFMGPMTLPHDAHCDIAYLSEMGGFLEWQGTVDAEE